MTAVPAGVDPATVIEIFSGEVIQLQSEVAKAKTMKSQLQNQVDSLQRHVKSTALAGVELKHRTGKKSVGFEEFADDSMTTAESSRQFIPSLKAIVIDESTATPQRILDSLDAAMLAQQILAQETEISNLRAQLLSMETEAINAQV